jgi:hypothetical protein
MGFHHPMLLATRERKTHLGSFPEDEIRPYVDAAGQSTTLEYRMHSEADVYRELCDLRPDRQWRPWFVLGDPGAGKSELLECWFTLWAGKLAEWCLGTSVPVLVRLRDVTPKDLSVGSEELGDRFWSLGLGSRGMLPREARRIYDGALRRLFRPVWLLDGLDEVEPDLLDPLLQAIGNLPGLGKLVTCRTTPYELIRARAQMYAGPEQAYAEREYEILNLTPVERVQFLTQAFAGDELRARDLARRLIASAPLRSLSTNRFMLALIAELSQRRELPQTRAGVVRGAIEEVWSRKLTRPEEWDLSVLRDRVLKEAARAAGGDWQGVIRVSEAEAGLDRAQFLRTTLQRSGLIHVSLRRAHYRFVLPVIGEFYRADALADEGLPAALDRHWDDPEAAEALALLIGKLFDAGRAQPLDADLDAFMGRWLDGHRRDPRGLWQNGRSPIRVILRLRSESGVPCARLGQVRQRLSDLAKVSLSCRLALAAESASPPELLAELAQAGELAVRRAVAANPSASPEALALLTADADVEVRRGVAMNWATPVSSRATLASDPDDSVRLHVALSSATPPELLVKLAGDRAIAIRLTLCRYPGVPLEALAVLAQDAIPQIAYSALQNPRLPPQPLEVLAGHPDPLMRCLVAAHPNLPPGRALVLSFDPDERVRQSLAANRFCPAFILSLLARAQSPWVRQKVAWNEGTSPDLLGQLARDPEAAVRQVVASNSGTPPAVARELENDPLIRQRPPYVRTPWMVLGDATGGQPVSAVIPAVQASFPPSSFPLPPFSPLGAALMGGLGDQLDQLARSPDADVRLNLAANAATSRQILAQLASDADANVRANVARNAAADEPTLMRLAKDEARGVRLAVARRTGAPAEPLALLARDADEGVRNAAAANPAALIEDLCILVVH